MPHSFEPEKIATFRIALGPQAAAQESTGVHLLKETEEDEVLDFLSRARSVQAVFMTGMVRDNGLESPFNRGVFYGCRRGVQGELLGVALIGHATLLETEDDRAMMMLARVARACASAHVILGEEEKIKRFWRYYAHGGQRPRLISREMLFELDAESAPSAPGQVEGLRPACLDDLAFVMPVQACMAFEESGVNPLERDAVGFRLRCARRIEQGRVWVWVEDGRLIFKADVMAYTPQAAYLEGVYTSPAVRNRSHGARCLQEVARQLLQHTRSINLLVNEQNQKAQDFYRRAGFRFTKIYDTIFLQPAG